MKEIIIVTGASSGMGREFAMQIEKKYQVDEIWVIARRKERLECLKEKLQTKVKIFALDLTQKESFEIIQEALFQLHDQRTLFLPNKDILLKHEFVDILILHLKLLNNLRQMLWSKHKYLNKGLAYNHYMKQD